VNPKQLSINENIPINTGESQPYNFSPENTLQPVDTEQKYRQIEYDPAQIKNQSINKPVSNAQSQQAQQQQIDPVQQVKSMISAGYSPSLGLLKNASDLLKTKKTDLSDTFFAILLQKLIKMYQKKQ
jgi:hypothetical protein